MTLLRTGKKVVQRLRLYLSKVIRRLRGVRTGRDRMSEVIATVHAVQERFEPPILCIETGTIRSYHEEHESTRKIGEALAGRGHLVSVDISGESIAISKDVCEGLSNITWVQSDSVSYLAGLGDRIFHFALLDSVNDPDTILTEFRLVVPRVPDGGVVMVDDAGILPDGSGPASDWEARKGHRIWALLQRVSARYEVVAVENGTSTQLRVPIDADNRERIVEGFDRLDDSDG